MPVKPKITLDMVSTLRDAYIDKKMSTTEISDKSEELFGVKISCGTIYKEMVRHGIPARSKSESVSSALSTLDFSKRYMTEQTVEFVDGFLLGDGNIGFDKNGRYTGARFQMGSLYKDWTDYAMSGFSVYCRNESYQTGKIDEKHPNQMWLVSSLTHPDIIDQARRWYPYNNEYKKVIPQDIRITPTSVMLWYLGDGSLTVVEESNTAFIRFATCSFTVEDIENILMPKLRAIGLECVRDVSKNDIRLSASSIVKFFDYIGHKSPIACYNHKFEYPEWLNLLRLSDIFVDKQEIWRAQYFCKEGKAECTKSPGGKMFLFTKEQANKLKKLVIG